MFYHNLDAARVSKTITVSGVTTSTFYISSHFEVTSTGGVTGTTKYYYFGAQRIAMRDGSGVTYLHSDHLGGTSVTTDASGNNAKRQVYFPFGGVRATSGSVPTEYRFPPQSSRRMSRRSIPDEANAG